MLGDGGENTFDAINGKFDISMHQNDSLRCPLLYGIRHQHLVACAIFLTQQTDFDNK